MPHRRAKRALAIVALTTTIVSCSSEPPPASTPTMQGEVIRLFSTPATFPLLVDLSTAYTDSYTHVTFEIQQGTLSGSLQSLESVYSFLFTQHIPGSIEGWAAPIAQDGIAIIAHPDLRITTLSPAQLRAVFQGQVQDWSQISDVSSQLIQVVSREAESDTLREFQRIVMGRRPVTSNAALAISSEQMHNIVIETPGSIGYVMYSQLREGVRVIEVDNVNLTYETIMEQTYPLRTTVYVVGLQEPSDEYQNFIDWIQTIEGQRIVSVSHIPLYPLP